MSTITNAPSLQDNRAYVNTYFRINTPSYGVKGWVDETQRNAYYHEVSDIIARLGFDVTPATRYGAAPQGDRGFEHLYCHPQELSGFVAEDSIDQIKQAIEHAKTFSMYHIDMYETVYNYTPDEFRAALDEQRDTIETAILERFKTKRRNLYLPGYALNVRSGIPYNRKARYNSDAAQLQRIESEYVSDLFNQLVAQSKIVTAQKNDTTYYRTRSPRDPKEVIS